MVRRTYDGLLGPEPYEAFVPHGISGWRFHPDQQTVRRVESAAERLGTLHQRLAPSAALQWCLNRAEGIASSDVEGISTTLRSLSLLESVRGPRNPGRQALDRQALGAVRLNAHAVAAGRRGAGPVTVSDIEGMHRLLFEDTEQPFVPGSFRDREVWIGAPGTRSPARAHYVPAPHEFVPSLMEDLVEYVSSPSWVHPLVTAAVAHLQFETIHPFLDGNGRMGRALMHRVLRRGLPGSVAVPLSAAIGERRQEYIGSLRPYQTYVGAGDTEVRAATAEAAISYIADAAMVACAYAEVVAESIAEMQRDLDSLRLRSHSAATAALAEMSTMPAVTVEYLARKTGRSTGSLRRGLRGLADAGVVAESVDEDSGRTVFELPALLHVVDQRSALLDRCWTLHESGIELAPSALLAQFRDMTRDSPAADEDPPKPARCDHIGVRSGARCRLRPGHAPPHRYTR